MTQSLQVARSPISFLTNALHPRFSAALISPSKIENSRSFQDHFCESRRGIQLFCQDSDALVPLCDCHIYSGVTLIEFWSGSSLSCVNELATIALLEVSDR